MFRVEASCVLRQARLHPRELLGRRLASGTAPSTRPPACRGSARARRPCRPAQPASRIQSARQLRQNPARPIRSMFCGVVAVAQVAHQAAEGGGGDASSGSSSSGSGHRSIVSSVLVLSRGSAIGRGAMTDKARIRAAARSRSSPRSARPAATPRCSRRLFRAGADAFRVNMSHGDHATHAETIEAIRALEKEFGRPIAILCDLQGPKLRVGTFTDGQAVIRHGAPLHARPRSRAGRRRRACSLPHPELFGVLEKGQRLLINDGKIRLRVTEAEPDRDRLHGRSRRGDLRPQGRQRARRRGADPGADREGPPRPRLRARARAPTGSASASSSGPRTSPRRGG